MIDWALLQHFLAVFEAGTLSRAARELGSSQPTVGRQIDALERAVGEPLFLRTTRGLVPTERAERLFADVDAMRSAAQLFERRVRAFEGERSGVVRLSASEGIAGYFLPPHLEGLVRRAGVRRIDLVVENRIVDLDRFDADLAIRLKQPTERELVAQRLLRIELGLVASRAYLREHGTPRRLADLARHRFVVGDGVIAHHARAEWLEPIYGEATVALRTTQFNALVASVEAGLGIGAMGAHIARAGRSLVHIPLADAEIPEVTAYVLTRREARRTGRVRDVARALHRLFVERASEFRFAR